jgi:hypothetical protein
MASLLGFSRAFSESTFTTAPALPTLDHLCFEMSGGPFPPNSTWPSVTMMYSGTTFTTAPVTLAMSGTIPIIAPTAASGSAVQSGNQVAVSSDPSGGTNPGSRETQASSEITFRSSASEQAASFSSSLASVPSESTLSTGPALVASSQTATTDPAITASDSKSLSTKTDISLPTPISGGINTMPDSKVPVVTAISGASSYDGTITQIASGENSDLQEKTQAISFVSPSPTGELSPSSPLSTGNGTVSLSSAAVDALQLAQYIKHLSVSVFNAGFSNGTGVSNGNDYEVGLAKVVTDISMVSFCRSRAVLSSIGQSLNYMNEIAGKNADDNSTGSALPFRW